jgi:hypothetical protein
MIEVPVSIGEVIDKITILQIKQEKITDLAKQKNVSKELQLLQSRVPVNVPHELVSVLKQVNERLWNIEEQIRVHEKNLDFGSEFIGLARSVYIINDQRAEIKKQINLATGSELIEEKSYGP